MEREPSRGKKRLSKKERIANALDLSKWTGPLCLKDWADIFGVPDTRIVKRWFESGVIKNKRLSARYWSIAIEEVPAGLTWMAATEEARQAWRDYIDRTTATGRPRDYVKATESRPLTCNKTH